MAKSSRHKSSHKQSKHSSKEARDCSSESEEDVKVKDRSGKGESSVRVSRDSEKRKVSSQSRDGHGEASEERVSSKRRKDAGDKQVLKSGSSRLESEKSSKPSKSKAESRSRSSRRIDDVSDRKEEIVEIVEIVDEKQKDVEVSVVKEKECGSDKERKVKEKKLQEAGKHTDYIEGKKKPKSRSLENNEKPKQHDLDNTDLAKELEKRVKSRGGFVEKDDHLDDKRGYEDGKLCSQREHSKDGRYKEDKHIDGSYKDSHRDYVDRESRHRDDKHKEETDNDSRSKDGRYKEDRHIDGSYKDSHRDYVDRESRHRDDKHKEETDNDGRSKDGRFKEDKHIDGIHKERYRDDVDRESRHRDNKRREETDRDGRHKDKHFDGSYKDNVDRDSRHRDSRHKEESERDVSHKDGKQREDVDKDGRYNDGKQRENCDQNSRQRDAKRRDDFDKDSGHGDGGQGKDLDKDGKHREKKYREDKYREDDDREKRYREDKYREDDDREKRYREDKYRDEYVLRDHPSDKYDSKRKRDESSYSESRSRKSKCQYAQDTKYKDDKKTRRFDYNEDESDMRSQKTSEHYFDVGNNSMNISKTQIVTDKDTPNSCNADSRRPSSPNFGSRGEKDKFRHSKQAESNYRDLSPEEKVIHDTNSCVDITGSSGVSEKSSMPQPRERQNGEDYSIKHELSSGRYLAPDVHTSPGQLVNGSTTSIINHVHMVEAGVRLSSDAEESGQRNKEARDLLVDESKKGLDFPLETPSVDDISQVDRDNFSPPSPISRTSHLPSNSRSRFHSSPSFRGGKDGPSGFGSFEKDNRGRSNNRYKRSGNSNMGRAQGNAWSGVPNWSSPVTGNFMHFQNGPPSVGFHPMMQQFSGPPMFGIRPFMEFAHSRGPYPIPDANGFSNHGHQFRWPNPVGDSCLPLAHGWDVKNGNDAHMYGGLDWDHSRSSMNPQGRDAGADILKGPSSLATMELPSTTENEDSSVHAPSDDISAAQSIQQSSNDLNELNFQAENGETYQPSDALAKETYKSSNTATAEKHNPSKMSQTVDACYFHAYLSRLDISADLSHPDLYDKCRSVMDMKQSENTIHNSSQFSFIEEVTEARVKISKLSPISSLFVPINDSVYQKAIQIYEKQQEETRAFLPSLSNGKKLSLYSGNNMDACADSDLGKAAALNSVSPEDGLEETKVLPAVTCEESDAPVAANSPVEPTEPIPSVEVTEMELDKVVNEENTHSDAEDKVSKIQESQFDPSYMEEDFRLQTASNVTEKDVVDSTTSNQLLFSDVPSEACETVMSECGSVNLSRIHHSTGSTH